MRPAIALGLVQGPTELAPVSSSAHVAILRGAAGADAAQRKSVEVAVHGGAAAALALVRGGALAAASRRFGADGTGWRRPLALVLALVPPAAAGYAFERPIERRLGGPRATAAGLALGAAAMAVADMRPATRSLERGEAADGLALGLAQACALMPGVSRRGATLAAARARGFGRADADALSWLVGLPVIAGACALKGARLVRERARSEHVADLRAGAIAAFGSTLIAARVAERARLGAAPLLPFCAYRLALAGALLRGARRRP